MKTRKPKFMEPNLDVVQMTAAGAEGWCDYTTIKTPTDMLLAISLVDRLPGQFRIVRKQMGTTVIYAH